VTQLHCCTEAYYEGLKNKRFTVNSYMALPLTNELVMLQALLIKLAKLLRVPIKLMSFSILKSHNLELDKCCTSSDIGS
jgi:hypothetical protein